jgi:hypothetical protein
LVPKCRGKPAHNFLKQWGDLPKQMEPSVRVAPQGLSSP